MAIQSCNPVTGETLASFEEFTHDALEHALHQAHQTFLMWRAVPLEDRLVPLQRLAVLFKERAPQLGALATAEMGKPITQAIAEVEKCATACEHYAEQAATYLAPEEIASDASRSYIRFDPLGVVLAVMPWNFPYWQAVRFLAPALAAGNVGLLKHASNVPQCAKALEQIVLDAGFPNGAFQNLFLSSARVEGVIRDPRVVAVTLTGSEPAGKSVAATAGSEIKRTVLELGGSDPFLVFADADLALAAQTAVKARFQNAGQSCIAAKRFLVEQAVYEPFLAAFVKETLMLKVGDPADPETAMGPVASERACHELEQQVHASLAQGARLVLGGTRLPHLGPSFFAPTILADVPTDAPVACDETFGPVAAVLPFQDEAEAIALANATPFGLGSVVFTQQKERIQRLAEGLEVGCVFVNGMVKSDPRLPFGGIKCSGYGRELSKEGMRAFCNMKTVWIA